MKTKFDVSSAKVLSLILHTYNFDLNDLIFDLKKQYLKSKKAESVLSAFFYLREDLFYLLLK